MAFVYRDQKLSLVQAGKEIPLSSLVKDGSAPVYVYDVDQVVDRYAKYCSSFQGKAHIHYAVKANTNKEILKSLASAGAGFDVVSKGEMQLVLDCGANPEKIVFSGVGKSRSELEFAVSKGIEQINVESPAELDRIIEVAKSLSKVARVAFRMNPDVDPETHPYIKTGFRENKFGMDESFVPGLVKQLQIATDHVQLVGLTLHIGSQIRELHSFVEAVKKTLPLYAYLEKLGFPVQTFDIGGGVGMNYEAPDVEEEFSRLADYGKQVLEILEPLGCEVLCEPGRLLAASAGVLLTQVEYIKETPYKKFAIVNSGMHHLMRPALYQAHHRILPLKQEVAGRKYLYDVVGPICESADVLGHERLLPELEQGDWLAVCEAGAYGHVMASDYNIHPFPKQLAFSGGVCLEESGK